MSKVYIKQILEEGALDSAVVVRGWVRTKRQSKNVTFININDGTTIHNIQAVVEAETISDELLTKINTGACLEVYGKLIASQGTQKVEVQVEKIIILGEADPEKYPIQPKKHSFEFLREKAHLRPRTNTFGAILRIRHALAFAIHNYFNDHGFFYLHTPIITGSDAEGAGEMFRVTTLDLKDIEFKSKRLTDRSEIYYHRLLTHIEDNNISDLLSDINGLLSSNNKISEKINFRDIIVATESKITRLKKDKNLRKLDPLFEKLYKKLVETNFFDRKESKKSKKIETYIPKWITSELLKEGTTLRLVNGYADTNKKVNVFTFSFFNLSITKRVIKSISDRVVDFSNDFFGKETNLTVSGQLEGELGAMALSKIYTFGPTFRAENSNTSRHLAEFWMIEPEVAFNDLVDNMDLAEDFLQYLVQYALEKCGDDLQFLDARFAEEEKQKPTQDRSELGLIDKLKFVVENKFQRLTYTEAIEVLKNAKKKFQFPVDWGTDLQSEHERYLVEKHFKKPVILTDYPEHIKAFYMKLSEDGKTVRAMDVLFPGIGEIIGGSQREEDYEKLKKRAHQFGIEEESVWWYLETRQFGTCPHAGFGLGFERLVLFVTGMSNIRDVIPFPRYPKSAEF